MALDIAKITIHSFVVGAVSTATAFALSYTGNRFASLALTTPKLYFIGYLFTACHEHSRQPYTTRTTRLVKEGAVSGALAVLIRGIGARPADLLTTSVAIFALNYISTRLYNETGLRDLIANAIR